MAGQWCRRQKQCWEVKFDGEQDEVTLEKRRRAAGGWRARRRGEDDRGTRKAGIFPVIIMGGSVHGNRIAGFNCSFPVRSRPWDGVGINDEQLVRCFPRTRRIARSVSHVLNVRTTISFSACVLFSCAFNS